MANAEAQSVFSVTSPLERSFDGSDVPVRLVAQFGEDVLPPASVTFRLADSPLEEGIIVQAEDLGDQGGGEVTISDRKIGMVGKAFLNWNDKGHWLEWAAEVPAEGKFHLLLRYCTQFPAAKRELMIDGKHPAESCKALALPGTGGWSNDRDDWRHYLVKNADGSPVVVELTEGKHTLRMSNLDGQGLNLDYLALVPAG